MVGMSPKVKEVLMKENKKEIKKINAGQNPIHTVGSSTQVSVPYSL